MSGGLLGFLRGRVPPAARVAVRQRLHRLRRPAWLGTLRRTAPLSDHWGRERGTPVDRYYIERFLDAHRADVRGHALEVMNRAYLDRFGAALTHVDVLDVDAANPLATLVADLEAPGSLPAGRFDCIVLTQTLQFVFDLPTAIEQLHRALRPGGVLLVTVPSVTRVDRNLGDREFWRFTVPSCRRLFGERFGASAVEVRADGNVLAAIAFLAGMAREELSARDLAARDERYPVIVTVRAVKAPCG
ncbi:hypothetical protein tb265_16210 [Gemmatimonadetes bacterium T265]|nr:hypothetical protein tb265_16210 [Gemmatimonadetes bacterium T265]